MSASRPVTRRQLLAGAYHLGLASLLAGPLAGCSRPEPQVRVVTNVWPGYELMYVAEKQGFFKGESVSMHAMPSATSCLQALAAGNAEAAGLTLDEVLSARADNMPLMVLAILNISLGGDVVLARPDITALADLRGKRIGVEQTAVGAVMLDALLTAAGLSSQDIKIVYATIDNHIDFFREGRVDALVTFHPIPQILKDDEAIVLFDSRSTPGRIIDVLAAPPHVIESSPRALGALVAGHFQVLKQWQEDPARLAPLIHERMGISDSQVLELFDGLALPDTNDNRNWLTGSPPPLMTSAQQLENIMLKASLLPRPVPMAGLIDARFLP